MTLHPRSAATTILLILLSGAPLWGETPTERGDRAYRRRATGFLEQGAVAPEPIATAVAVYDQALTADPDNLRLRFKLMNALYFQGYHVLEDKTERREVFERLVDLAIRSVEQCDRKTGRKEAMAELSLEGRAKLLRAVPEAAQAYYWLTASWGLWGMTHSKLAAVTQGVATKVRDYSKMITLLDEDFRNAAGLRMLGRLYTEAPKVPFFTGWIDRQEGLDMLRRALEISRRDPRNLFFLAEAILDYDPDHREQAVALLREIVRRGPAPEEVVEHSETVELAKQLLAELDEDP